MERAAGPIAGRHGHYRYSCGRLHALRSAAAARPEPAVLTPLATLGILRYRGRRGGRRKQRPISVITSSSRVRGAPRNHACSHRQSNRQLMHRSLRSYPQLGPTRVRLLVRPATERPNALPPPLPSTPPPQPPPSIYVINANSIAKPHALEQLYAELTGYDIDIAIVTETHFKKKHLEAACNINGYRAYRRDRESRRAGGVAVFVRDSLGATECVVAGDTRVLELLWIKVSTPGRAVYIGALYHPPKPIYRVEDLMDQIERSVEELAAEDSGSLIVLAGDINQLNVDTVAERTGLTPLVKVPTRGENTLDMIFVSEECYQSIKVVTSAIKTDHKAIIAVADRAITSRNKNPVKAVFRKRSPAQHALLLSSLTRLDEHPFLAITDPQSAWDYFYREAEERLSAIYPLREITMTSKDPSYMTPELKYTLKCKNRLMRAGRVEEAGALAVRISKEIVAANTIELKNIDVRNGVKELWDKVNSLTNRRGSCRQSTVTAADLNQHYAAISTDPQYSPPEPKLTASAAENIFSEYQIFQLLDHLHHTAEGLDRIPAWYLRLAAPKYAIILAHLINQSLLAAHVPNQWKTAIILPIAKVPSPLVPADYRPISILPVLSRLVEKEVVRRFLYPTITRPPTSLILADQFAYRPTGSTTAALTTLFNHITVMLRTNAHVTLISMDYSKAFDTVRHSSLLDKLAKLDIPDAIYNWIVNYFHERKHITRFEGVTSTSCPINSSVVQGSAIGPAGFVVTASDLHPVNQLNKLLKYADDMYLLVAGNNTHTIQTELDHIAGWAAENNLRLNPTKTSEMVIKRPGSRAPPPPPTTGLKRVTNMKILGVTVQDNLSMDAHITEVISSCSSSLYALRVLRNHGLPPASLHEVARASTMARLMYASPAWWGFASEGGRDRVEAFIRKTKRFGYLPPTAPCASELSDRADETLFNATRSDIHHVLHDLLPTTTSHEHFLRPRAHNFVLPDKDDRNFVNRMLFKDIY